MTGAKQTSRFLLRQKTHPVEHEKHFYVVWTRMLKIFAIFVYFAFLAVSAYGFDKLWYNRNAM